MQATKMRLHVFGLMAALVVQYALGMYVNLFVAFPENATEGQLWEFAWAHWPVATHIVLAVLLLLGAIALCVRVARARIRPWIWPAFVALLALFVAGFSGGRFIPTQTDLYSYTMSLGFIVAFMSYAWGLYASRASV